MTIPLSPNPVSYWRNSLADAARTIIDVPGSALRDVTACLPEGRIDNTASENLIDATHHPGPDGKKTGLIPVLLAPFRVSPIYTSGKHSGEKGIVYPFWVRAVLNRAGQLIPDEDTFLYIPRDYLEPQTGSGESFILSDVNRVDRVFSIPYNGEKNWEDYWLYVEQRFTELTGVSMALYNPEGFTVTRQITVVADETLMNAADALIGLYDSLLRQPTLPPLLAGMASQSPKPLRPLLTPEQLETASARYPGQMGYSYPLSVSQRKSLYHAQQLQEGEVLAVNGPPGTGKTTLLQSVVAGEVVRSALAGKQPAVILACSTNNQAVTNILDSFANVQTRSGPLYGRWLPQLQGFGSYLVSQRKRAEVADNRQPLTCKGVSVEGMHRDLETGPFLAEADTHFIRCYNAYASVPLYRVADIVAALHQQLQSGQQTGQEGIRLWQQYRAGESLLQQLDVRPAVDWPDDAQLSGWENGLKALEERVSTYLDTEPFWMKLLSFLPAIRNKRAMRVQQLFRDCPVGYGAVDWQRTDTLPAFFNRTLTLIGQLLANSRAWQQWKVRHHIRGNPPRTDAGFRAAEQSRTPFFYDELETGLHYDQFYRAVHYWEGRWLLETRQALAAGTMNRYGEDTNRSRWQRFAMLTPCFVSTCYMAPKFFTYSKFVSQTAAGTVYDHPPLTGSVDLLIIDEAGQVSPEVGAAIFALAKRAVVVGDTLQIEPVWNVPKRVDYANLVRHGLIDTIANEKGINQLLTTGHLSSAGSIMKLAQNASPYQLYPQAERGMLLTEHRRCWDEIIGYCNNLAYGGLLEPRKGKATGTLLAPMQFVATGGDSIRVGSSRGNPQEADELAGWLLASQERILHHYQAEEDRQAAKDGKPAKPVRLADLIGIITPFTGQKQLLQRVLKNRGIDTAGLTIGTVHALQGAERPVILFSATYGENDRGSYFYDNGVNMLNVAVSRAKEAFIVFGNPANFDKAGNTPSAQLYRHIQQVSKHPITS